MNGKEEINPTIYIRPGLPEDRDWLRQLLVASWGGPTVVVHGVCYRPVELPAFIAWQGGERVGAITYRFAGGACEIVTLNSLQPSRGIGTALVDAVITAAQDERCRRVWLVTTNDNLNALRFYQKRGFRLVRIERDAVLSARRLKPEIPEVGQDGIPLRDEIELEFRFFLP